MKLTFPKDIVAKLIAHTAAAKEHRDSYAHHRQQEGGVSRPLAVVLFGRLK